MIVEGYAPMSLYPVAVAGESFRNDDGSDRHLVREPDNRFDDKCVKVISARGVQIGNVAREASWVPERLDRGSSVQAVIRSIGTGPGGKLGVVLEVLTKEPGAAAVTGHAAAAPAVEERYGSAPSKRCWKCRVPMGLQAAECPSCGADMSKYHVSGAPAGSTSARNKAAMIIGGVLFSIGSLAALVAGGGSPSNNVPPPAAEAPLKVTAEELFAAYESNEPGAQNFYGDRPLEVSGEVDKVRLDFSDDPVIGLRTSNRFMSAQASLVDEAHDRASDLRSGDSVTLLCEDVMEVAGLPMLRRCRFKPASGTLLEYQGKENEPAVEAE